jgi:error-prone DNA polymerase
MSRKRSHDALEAYRGRFIEGAATNGVGEKTANCVFDKLVGFSGFGFPKSHAAAFGLLAYQSQWLRRHHPAEFLCALLNEQPMGFYPPATLVRAPGRRQPEWSEVCARGRGRAHRAQLHRLSREGRCGSTGRRA